MYKLLFPLEKTDDNRHGVYDLAIVSDGMGVVNPNWWHFWVPCPTLEDGIKLGRKILRALQRGKECPCKQALCRLGTLPNYFVDWAPEAIKKSKP